MTYILIMLLMGSPTTQPEPVGTYIERNLTKEQCNEMVLRELNNPHIIEIYCVGDK